MCSKMSLNKEVVNFREPQIFGWYSMFVCSLWDIRAGTWQGSPQIELR
jgi:hypothetical protein